MTKQAFKSWDQYTSEAKHAPFELPVSEKETIIIEPPSGAQLIKFSRAYRDQDAEAMIVALCGEAFVRVNELIGVADYRAMSNLTTDMMLHFDLADEHTLVGPGGGKITESDPRKIRALMKKGYQIEGEADASRI